MPIHTCSATPDIFDAVWTYIPNEVIDFSKFEMIRSLVIECFGPDQLSPPTTRTPWCLLGTNVEEQYIMCSGQVEDLLLFAPRTPTSKSCSPRGVSQIIETSAGPYTFPSLHMFPLLEKLIIQNTFHSSVTGSPVYIKAFTDIPPHLLSLEIHNSLIEDIGSIIQQCHHLTALRLHNNLNPINITYLPPTLNAFYVLGETFTSHLRIPFNTAVIRFVHSTIPYIYMDHALVAPKTTVVRHERFIIAGCQTPYNPKILADNKIRFIQKVHHILFTNAQHIYQHFGSIPTRIRVSSEEELNNPIIKALNLASNYPRRMAEFIA